ncbi:Aste57867_25497 [Aphanomyces stellatus]|uniref:Aste57867_25497 protein n=1 Tax=Aphanomyces stellatus TaxID=120398 RepID=A0A485LTF9_9STRA|nr:hypothetical protein As57867_025418 [Aphanomyces stellatus]VFU02120.1 Aste57867_25497 [Aphanomyces stellatus]
MTGFMLHSCSLEVRSKVLDIITNERLSDIKFDYKINGYYLYRLRSLVNRGIVIRAIQQQLTSPLTRNREGFQKAAFNVLRGTYGNELTLLKENINCDYLPTKTVGGGFTGGDLHQLIYGCPDLTQVVPIVQHIAVESLKVEVMHKDKPLVKIISDIDDTLFPGWSDARYPGHILYPGVAKLYESISHGVDDRSPSITFLTARPRVSLGVVNPTVLNGSVRTGMNADKIAGLKMDNFIRYATLFPEYKFVFFGDSGQGDALLASQMLAHFPDKMLGVFIHDIDPTSDLTGDGGLKATYVDQGVSFYENYAAAGISAFERGLLTKEDLEIVIQSCHDELNLMKFTGWNAKEKHAQRKRELQKDSDRAVV